MRVCVCARKTNHPVESGATRGRIGRTGRRRKILCPSRDIKIAVGLWVILIFFLVFSYKKPKHTPQNTLSSKCSESSEEILQTEVITTEHYLG